MKYLSLCSGIEAASIAWQPLGWRPIAFAEIDPFCCALLAQRFPEVPNLGDITKIKGCDVLSRFDRPDLVVAGTPCQSFSVAGKRLGIRDPRGNITLHFLRLVGEIRPKWVVWENVPGVLSIDGGKTFRDILAALDECGYGLAWRVLDAQFFGVPQRRRRVFLVGYLGDWRPAAAVLLESAGGAWPAAPGREARQEDPGAGSNSIDGDRVAATLEANYSRMYSGSDFENLVAGTVSAKWSKGAGGPSGDECQNLIAGRSFAVRTAQTSANGIGIQPDASHCLDGSGGQAVVFERHLLRNGRGAPESVCPPLKAQSGRGGSGDSAPVVASCPEHSGEWFVRRFTPRECERLQGFPDDWTLVEWRGKPASDTQRYKAIGNSMAIPVVRWIGERIKIFESHDSA